MLTLIEGAELYGPTAQGLQDLLVADGRIAWMGRGLSVPADWPLARVDYRLLSGARAGGSAGPHHWRWWRGGFGFRTPELAAREALSAGVTTLVAALGTDSLTRSPAQVLGKVREFRAAGVSAFMYTGSYHLPVKTLTGTVESDIMLIPEVLGWEVAISDHRSSAPTHDELARLVSEARVAGLLAGKSGVSFFHLGTGAGRWRRCGLCVMVPTSRCASSIPPTATATPGCLPRPSSGDGPAAGSISPPRASRTCWTMASGWRQTPWWSCWPGVPADRISFSSDANASLPRFDGEGRLIELRCGQIGSLWQALVESCDKGSRWRWRWRW